MRFAQMIIMATAALALSGCWVSGAPLIDRNSAEMPDVSGHWVSASGAIYELEAAPKDRSFTTYYYSDPDSKIPTLSTLRFDHIEGEWYVVQQVNSSNAVEGYKILRVEGVRVAEYTPECRNEIIALDGVVQPMGSSDCRFSTLAALENAAKLEISHFDDAVDVRPVVYKRQ